MPKRNVWDSLGYAEHHLGNLAEAAACYQRALSLFRELGDRYNEAEILIHLGDTHHAAGDLAAGPGAWQQALAILVDLHHPGADQVRAKLLQMTDPPAACGPIPQIDEPSPVDDVIVLAFRTTSSTGGGTRRSDAGCLAR